ncbi:PQQ-binding-like beta-propeller repeat protein [Streptomyces lincolnensis]|uniref:outer membrane protein assembly factor BamB family protein n=1 Tax=Streptomyces lincolnensis TaxID=1915 RepID=UPI001E4E2433|nr:PQQ-binding-like beta-propeller repeat protein [Streptomyces lincolnensis]MCD7441572.1 PQQ-binding-like beta-propeller repeat protein [Streptomyces lincolnensis]
MTQPPNQPPQDGFGAPQGDFGAPQDQPPQPGYGYPEQPPAAPQQGAPQQPGVQQPGVPQPGPYGQPPQPSGPYAQPGPYGQPAGPYAQPGPYGAPGAAQPGPYGQPQPPGPYGQQPGYGYPPQPQYPGGPGTPPPGSGSRNPFRGRPALVIGAAVAALLVIGGTVFAVSGGDDKEPVAKPTDDAKPSASASGAPVNPGDGSGDGAQDPENLNEGRQAGESKVLWYKEAPDAPGNGADANGMWITDKTAVKSAYKQLVAYNVGDGRPTWAPITFPAEICAVTPQKTSDDKIVVAYKNGTTDRAKCSQLQQVDLNTGAKGWSGEVADGAAFDSAIQVSLTLSGNTLMVGRSQSGTAYDVRTGKKLFDKKRYGEACFPSSFAGGPRLISVASCDAAQDTEHDEVQELDPTTGKVKWTQKFDKGWRIEKTYSVDPLVIYSTNDDKNSWNIATFTAAGKFRSQVAFDEEFAPDCGGGIALTGDLEGCRGLAADANTLYLPTEATSGANEIVAINLSDGKEKWRVKSPVAESMQPMKVEGGKLIAYVEASYDAGGRVVSIPTTGSKHTPTTLLQNPQGVAEIESGFYSKEVAWVGGRFYLSTSRLSGNDDTKEKLMLAYGK